eukprot:194751-Prorocentrum_minimum.AAC.1
MEVKGYHQTLLSCGVVDTAGRLDVACVIFWIIGHAPAHRRGLSLKHETQWIIHRLTVAPPQLELGGGWG